MRREVQLNLFTPRTAGRTKCFGKSLLGNCLLFFLWEHKLTCSEEAQELMAFICAALVGMCF